VSEPSGPSGRSDPGRRFEGKVAIVTGGASGIGLAASRRLVAEGGKVVVGDLNADGLKAVADELGDAVGTVVCDVTVEDDVAALADAAVEQFGGLQVAFANAGIGSLAKIIDADAAEWSKVLDVNVVGPMLTIKHAARRMADGGSIIVTASLNAVQPGLAMSAYCASKAGVAMLVECAAMELGEQGIRVNAVGPGLVRTGLTDAMWMIPPIVDEYVENTTVGRSSTPEEIASLVAFLASDEASFISGSLHLIDGGAATKRYPDLLGLLAEAGMPTE
jgi:NAD(P)-dependent dehydrogenase (short-subunit alcohol dehydrogenase family)